MHQQYCSRFTPRFMAAMVVVILGIGLFAEQASAELLGHWKFDEGSGTTATDEVGSYAAGGTTEWATGVDGSGSAVSAPRLLLDATDSLTLNTVDSLTVSLWVKLDDAQDAYTGIAGFKGTGGGEPYAFKMVGETLQWDVNENVNVDQASFFDTYGTSVARRPSTYVR